MVSITLVFAKSLDSWQTLMPEKTCLIHILTIADEFFIYSEGTHFLNFSVAFCYTNQDGHISLSSQIRYLFAVKTIPKLTLGFLSYQE